MPEPDVPHIPDPSDLSKNVYGEPVGGDAVWTVHRGAHRPCDWCVRVIHQGLYHRHPQPGRMRRKGPVDTVVLCHQHGQRQRERDDKVKAHLKEMRASTNKARRR
jgi:hypothetical protein